MGVLDDDDDGAVLPQDLLVRVPGHRAEGTDGRTVVAVERGRSLGGAVGCQRLLGLTAGVACGRHVEPENNHEGRLSVGSLLLRDVREGFGVTVQSSRKYNRVRREEEGERV